MAKFVIVPFGFIIGSLMLFAEMTSARLFTIESVGRHQLAKLEKVCHASRFFKLAIFKIVFARDFDLIPE
jgi:hypothetical protein